MTPEPPRVADPLHGVRAYPLDDNRTFVALENVMADELAALREERDFLRGVVRDLSSVLSMRGSAS